MYNIKHLPAPSYDANYRNIKHGQHFKGPGIEARKHANKAKRQRQAAKFQRNRYERIDTLGPLRFPIEKASDLMSSALAMMMMGVKFRIKK